MNLQHRIDLIAALGTYMEKNDADWRKVKEKASQNNAWFIPEFIDIATQNITNYFLNKPRLEEWANHYHPDEHANKKNVGIVMAGNIPMVGFHDFLSVFISGHAQTIKLSSKDEVLLSHLIEKLYSMDPETRQLISKAEMLKGCDAYIATGSNNTARYFEQYFSKYLNIIRHNRTAVGVITGNETTEDLEKLSDDVHLYFGLGCRNITKLFVPKGYDFVPLINAFNKYRYLRDHNKYANNYDYQLSILLLNNVYYMTNGSTLLVENKNLFSPISILNYEYYEDKDSVKRYLHDEKGIQCTCGNEFIAFGTSQQPDLFSYADGIDTMQFLQTL